MCQGGGSGALQSESVKTYMRKGWEFFFFSNFFGYELGDGSKSRFWYDLWCGDQPLKTNFLELFCIA